MNLSDLSLSKATISTDKLLANVKAFRSLLEPNTKFMAVIKADAYSHGSVVLARSMEEAGSVNFFGVAQLREAIELREAGIETPILVFNSVRPAEVPLALEHNITMTVFSVVVAEEVVRVAETLDLEARVHLKVDSGMARLGVATFDEAMAVYHALNSSNVLIEGIYTHFADATDVNIENFTHEQFARFKAIIDLFGMHDIHFDIRHSCNTAGTLNFPDYHLDMVRVGLGIYGMNPNLNSEAYIQLQPVERVSTTVTHIKDFPAGESVGYGRTYFSDSPIKIATVAIGYADGVAKSLSNKGFFTYKGHQLPIIGSVCMDQTMLDCSEVPDLVIGDEVTYFGNPKDGDLLMTEVAKVAGASQYDLLCRIGNRVNRVYQ